MGLRLTGDDSTHFLTSERFDPYTDSPTFRATWLRDGDAGLWLVTKLQVLLHSVVCSHNCIYLNDKKWVWVFVCLIITQWKIIERESLINFRTVWVLFCKLWFFLIGGLKFICGTLVSSGFESQGRPLAHMLCGFFDPRIYVWCDTCHLLDGQHGIRVF